MSTVSILYSGSGGFSVTKVCMLYFVSGGGDSLYSVFCNWMCNFILYSVSGGASVTTVCILYSVSRAVSLNKVCIL